MSEHAIGKAELELASSESTFSGADDWKAKQVAALEWMQERGINRAEFEKLPGARLSSKPKKSIRLPYIRGFEMGFRVAQNLDADAQGVDVAA